MSESKNDYLLLRDEIDSLCEGLTSIHKDNMLCKEGCDSCCMDFGILAVEFQSIKQAIDLPNIVVNNKASEAECPFLVNGTCSIYNHRPIICRTHGYPLLQTGENERELSFCDLNFTKVDNEYFDMENCFRQDLYNSKLFMLNRKFLEVMEASSANPELYPLSALLDS